MFMPRCELDHIVIGASTLADGVRYIREKLGVEIPPGGKHPLMSTHNHLMRLGDGAFLEVISIDPDAPPPARPRWFNLDDPAMRARLIERPRAIAWVIRSPDIAATVEGAAYPPGEITSAKRDALSWRLTIPADGAIPGDGVLPHIIEWDNGARPWERMADRDCRLEALMISHPEPESVSARLRSVGANEIDGVRVTAGEAPELQLRILGPLGATML
jgi:hypothetical protein